MLTTTLIFGGIAYILTSFTASHILLAACTLGVGLGLGQPLSVAYVLEISPKDQQGEVLGLRLFFNRAFQATAPFIFGAIGGIGGLSSIFWASGGVLLIGAYLTRISTPETEEKIKKRRLSIHKNINSEQ